MSSTGRGAGAAVIIALLIIFLGSCASARKSRKVEAVAAVETVAVSAEATTQQEQNRAEIESLSLTRAEALDSGRVTIERDSAGLPVAINWRRSVAGTTAAKANEVRNERRDTEQLTAAESRETTAAESSEETRETEPQKPRRSVGVFLLFFLFLFLICNRRTK